MVDLADKKLSVSKQCRILKINRSTVYYKKRPIKPLDLEQMKLIDEQYLKTPSWGSRSMRNHLRRLGYKINRKRVQRLMRIMGLEAIYPKPKTSRPHPGHKVYPYLLRNLKIDRPNQVWAADITYIPMCRGFMYLVAIMDWHSRKVLSWRLSNTLDADFCVEALEEALRQFEKQLHRLFVFDPFPMGVKQCGVPGAFAEEPGVFLCTEYVSHLYDALRNQEKAKDFLSFSIFNEVAHQLLQKWNHPEAEKDEKIDEFAVVLMLMLNQKNRVIGAGDFAVKNPSAFNTMMTLFQDDRHPLTAKRGRDVLNWAKDSTLPKKWQSFLVPHMQTALLKRLQQKPTSWTDLSLVEKELAARDKKAI